LEKNIKSLHEVNENLKSNKNINFDNYEIDKLNKVNTDLKNELNILQMDLEKSNDINRNIEIELKNKSTELQNAYFE